MSGPQRPFPCSIPARVLVQAVGLLLLLTAHCPAGVVNGPKIDVKKIDHAARRALRRWHVPGVAVAIVRDGEIVYLAGHGLGQLDPPRPMTPDTVFPIASCTKNFTTTALAILNDEKRLHWDDPVRKHVPFFHLSDPLADQEVRLRDLVCHRTGLASHDLLWYHSPWPQEEIIRRAGLLPLDRPFRSTFQYQSIMFTATGFAVARASGMPWADFVRQRLLNPLGMTASRCSTRDLPADAERAQPNRLDTLGVAQAIPAYPLDVPDAAGSIQSTARDLSRWLLFQLGDGKVGEQRIVSAERMAEIHRPQIPLRMDRMDRAMFPTTQQMSYSMGWVVQDYRGQLLWQHAGAIDGFRVHFTLVPRARLGFVLLSNLHQTRMNVALSNTLLDLLLNLPSEDWHERILAAERHEHEEAARADRDRQGARQPNTQPSRELAAYLGSYEHPAYGTIRITLEEDALTWHWNRFHSRLEHFHFDTFTLDNHELPELRATFHLDARGTVARLHMTGGMNVEFVRK